MFLSMQKFVCVCVCVAVFVPNTHVRMYSSMLYYVCACHCDYVHREINLGTSTFAIDPVCARMAGYAIKRFNRRGF